VRHARHGGCRSLRRVVRYPVRAQAHFPVLSADLRAIPVKTLALASVGWFVFPALALFAGAAPFLGSQMGRPECE
jgi:hypothetical protein